MENYEDRIEEKVLEAIVREADRRWPTPKEFGEKFVVPILGAKDPLKTGRVLKGVGKNQKFRRLKLSEALRMAKLLDLKLHLLLSDAEIEVDRDIRNNKK